MLSAHKYCAHRDILPSSARTSPCFQANQLQAPQPHQAADLELHVDDTLVSAHINPYFLRINLPGPVTEDDQSSAAYDAATGYLNLTLTKCLPGQEFKDLDLLSKLLAPRQPATSPGPPSIEVLSDDPSDIGPTEEDEYVDEAAQLSDRMHQLSLERQEILKGAVALIRSRMPICGADIYL